MEEGLEVLPAGTGAVVAGAVVFAASGFLPTGITTKLGLSVSSPKSYFDFRGRFCNGSAASRTAPRPPRTCGSFTPPPIALYKTAPIRSAARVPRSLMGTDLFVVGALGEVADADMGRGGTKRRPTCTAVFTATVCCGTRV